MGDSAALNQKKRKIALDPDEEDDDPARTITVKTSSENFEKDEYKHEKDAKKDIKKPEGKPHEETKKHDKAEIKPKPVEKNPVADKKPEKSAQIASKNGEKKDKPASKTKEPERKKSSEPPKKRKISSSSESDSDDSSSDDSDSSSSEEESKKKKKKATPKKEAKKDSKQKHEPNKVVKSKDILVYEVLKRWWYCMEDWPPKEFDYTRLLADNGLRKVDIKSWKLELEEKNGLHKCFEVPSYAGLFKNSKGELFDLRPKETCPCYDTLRVKPVVELLEMLVKAYTNQISTLEKSEFCDPSHLTNLKKELFKTEKNYEANKNRK